MTSKELANLLGVSQSTVSRALNNSPRVPAEVRERVHTLARKVGFELNSHAQSLKTNRTGTVGVLFPNHFRSMTENLMLAHIFDHIQRDLIANDCDVMMVYDYGPGSKASALERMIRCRKLDGLILFRKVLSEDELELIKSLGFPCVYMLNSDSIIESISRSVSDNEYGGFLAGRFFGQFPDYRPLFLGPVEDVEKSQLQCQGLRRGLALHGRTLPEEAVLQCNLSMTSAYDFVKANASLFTGAKAALMTHTDILAIGALAALRDLHVSVPDQVQLLGADDIPMAKWVRPRLSALHVPVAEMVAAGCRLLRELLAGRKNEVVVTNFMPRLVLRETTLQGDSYDDDRLV